jgi:hypothetical protein
LLHRLEEKFKICLEEYAENRLKSILNLLEICILFNQVNQIAVFYPPSSTQFKGAVLQYFCHSD